MASKTLPVIVVTGASRGLGKAVCHKLASQGANIVGVARSEKLLSELKDEIEKINPECTFVPCAGDLSDGEIAKRIVNTAVEKFGRIDGLVNNAGALEPVKKIANCSVEEWKRHFDINVFAVMDLTKEALPYLRKSRGRTVNISSGASTRVYQAWGAYCTSKAALNMFSACLAAEEQQIVSVAIRPGVVKTEMQTTVYNEGAKNMDPSEYQKFQKLHDESGLLPPEIPGSVIANLVLNAGRELSGRFLSFDDPELASFRD
ncbi:hypothetical protein H4219_000353 [Mycoemilia scoparia]|uniref:Uncharacterized protein n=1 Tax=Mycoemilia scoparia TaxID=417184 RepID=A0A9W8A9K4_9FUNG|nr:hypothetical protein H4219_000353 [Mycoemilia scoparia]